jgi:uncharacterized membrane protein
MTNPVAARTRIQSIDVLRGLVMVIMALDHVRDFFYKAPFQSAGAIATGPTDLDTTTPALFFTRWITHFCAPIFVFLAGTSIFMMSRHKTKKEVSAFVIKRGIWLVLVEFILITLAWTFNPTYEVFILQVIWAIGISMILLGLLIWLPYKVLLVLGLIIVFGHNLLDIPSVSDGLRGGFFMNISYFASFSFYPLGADHGILIVYSFLPWTGLMLLGYCFGRLYESDVAQQERKKILLGMGTALIILFLLLRLINVYGDPLPWSQQPRGSVFSFLSFMNANKYPPSLAYLCMTIGPGLIFLALIEHVRNRFTNIMNVFGRVPMLYYILHLYLIHLIGVIVFYASGFTSKDIHAQNGLFWFKPDGLGFGLPGVYIVWFITVLLLYPICSKYNQYKSTHRKWWFSYV